MPLGKGSSPVKDAMLGFLNKGNVGGAQSGTPNAPSGPGGPQGGISIPASQLGPVAVGDTVTLTVTSVDGDNVSLDRVDQPTAGQAPDTGTSALPPIQ